MSNTTKQPPLKQVRSILVSQPAPIGDAKQSPYYDLIAKYGIEIVFKQFIKIEPLDIRDFRKQKIHFQDYTAVIFTSRNAVDNYFRLCQDARFEVPATMKYFCISEQTSNYLQKYITIRKRKIFTGKKTAADMFDILRKHKTEKFLFPCSNLRKEEIPIFMEQNGFTYKEAVVYNTVANDLSELKNINDFDMIAFFSPSGVQSLFKNFPDFSQQDVRIAAFGPTTAQAVREHGLVLDVEAPLPNAPSMTGAIEMYIRKANGVE